MRKFSVIIPLYNGARVIEKTLDSVLNQTYNNYEIILVNDGSPDNVGEVVNNYIATHQNRKFIYLEQKNKGLGGARNTAIKHAKGEIIALLDQDDIWYPEKLELVDLAYERNPEAEFIGHEVNTKNNGKIVGSKPINCNPEFDDMHAYLLYNHNCISTLAATFKRSVVNKIGLFSENHDYAYLVEDYDYWLRLAKSGCKFKFINKILGEYCLHETNFAKTFFRKMIMAELAVVKHHHSLRKDNNKAGWRLAQARIYYKIGHKLFFFSRLYFEGMYYLLRSIFCDPRYIYNLLQNRR